MPKVLLVEDDESMRKIICARFESTFELLEAGDAASALSLALQHKPDCILLDLTLPEYSGFELCQAFSSLSATRLIPILVISGQPASECKEQCLNLGAADYFEKPLDFQRLTACLNAVVDFKPSERRREPRVKLSVKVKLSGTDAKGQEFSGVTVTDDVSASGFLAPCPHLLTEGAEVDVLMVGEHERFVGRAKVVRGDWDDPWGRYGFRFVAKPRNWILG